MNILIAYDGTVHAKKALAYGIEKVRGHGGSLTVLQIFDPSLFVGYDAIPGAEALAKREAADQLLEVKHIIAEQAVGVPVAVLSSEGDASSVLGEMALKEPYDFIMLPQRLKATARSLPRPAMIVPGTILVPVDSSAAADTETIIREAGAIGAKVLLLGIVPTHLFSREEKAEIENVERATEERVRALRADLGKAGIHATSILRSGYPDEEVLSAARDHNVSLILLPNGGPVPSELSKAATMLLDEPQRLRWPLALSPA